MNLNLQNKQVLITGSTRGIGLAIAKAFLGEESEVYITSRNEQEADKAANEVGAKAKGLACDFTQPSEITKLAQEIGEAGGLDILICNVGSGISVPDPVSEEAQFQKILDLNFKSAVDTTRTFLPLIEKSKGSILFISSITGLEAIGAPVDYSVAKSALIAFSKNLARKLGSVGVRVNTIAPGNIYFDGGRWEELQNENPEKVQDMLKTTVPMQRFGTPDEIANAAVFLCSEKASFITGACLTIDGGQTVSI